ncbi:M20/M25/M40 family metallo-hydrolase [Undibacterium sp.]|uniref:M20/M25/M40 family metallo-hydrolase n=1 Tax=Undibacterium sp. TaxID=1914977 RepID=UPI0025E23720|nr:M20/M25/M40 family metallo-hydrolase [Undibacterium sp.]
MQKKLITSLLLAAFSVGATNLYAADKVWITLGDAAYAELQKLAPKTIAKESKVLRSGAAGILAQEKVHLVQVDESVLLGLSGAIHHKLNRCGGFMSHTSEASGRAALMQPMQMMSLLAPSYVIDNQATVTPYLTQMQDSNIGQTIVDMSAFPNRYYTTTNGVNASNWLKTKWQQMSAARGDILVEQFTHTGWAQKSVILTIQGTDNASEVVVLGGHLDSINLNDRSESAKAPGADDDASGIASLTEVIRVMLANNYKPRRTLKFIGYSAEEVGLKGSAEIAAKFKADNVNVVGVMQLDMTNYKGSAKDIYLYTDYTNAAQNSFVANLISTYLPSLTVGNDVCGYACSDHASWTAQGYPASMPFESLINQDNPYIHTPNDTYANSGSQALGALKFARMAMAYAVELGSDGAVVTPPPGVLTKDVAVSFSGAAGDQAKYTFAVPAGASNLSFKMSGGSGDGDLYTQLATAPSTSSYLAKSDGSSNAENILIATPTAGSYHLLANAYAAVSGASIVASYSSTTPPPGCTPSATVLCSGTAVSGISLALNASKTYTIVVPAGKSSLTFKLSGGSGDGDLYVKLGSAPSSTVYDGKSDGSTNAETVTINSPAAGTYYLLLKAYAAVNGASLVATIQ